MRRMTKCLVALLVLSLMAGALCVSSLAQESGCFVLTAITANRTVIEPTVVRYEEGQTIQEALANSGYTFTGLEDGFVSAIEGVEANYVRFYDGGNFDLERPASSITAMVFSVREVYSENLLILVKAMAAYGQMENNVQDYPPAQAAYAAALKGIRSADSDTARLLLDNLSAAIDAYAGLLGGEKYTVAFSVSQEGVALPGCSITMTDAYGNVTKAEGLHISVIAGEYSFEVSDGGVNRTQGSIAVPGATSVTASLPFGEWFAAVQLLNAAGEPYGISGNGAFQIPDTAGTGGVYLNAQIGDVPDRDTTRLRTIYIGTDGKDKSTVVRSWNSNSTSLSWLLSPSMTGRDFMLEAQYTGADGYTMVQSHAVSVVRVPTLKSLSVSAQGVEQLPNFNPGVFEYDLSVIDDAVTVNAAAFSEGCTITANGKSGMTVAVAQNTDVAIEALHVDSGQKSVYILHITKADAVNVTLTAQGGVELAVYNAAGTQIPGNQNIYRLVPGQAYTYIATKDTYFHATASFTAAAGLTLAAAAPETANALTGAAFYNASNAATRDAYPPSPAFSPEIHTYTCQVSDAVSSLYAQASALEGYAVNAVYAMQTTSAATHGGQRSVALRYKVDASGYATYLANSLAVSGYPQTITLRLEKTVNQVTFYQDYEMRFIRVLHLKTLSASIDGISVTMTDQDGKTTSFDRDVTDYYITVPNDTVALTLSADYINDSDTTPCCGGYYALVNGAQYDRLDQTAIELDASREKQDIAIRICHADERGIETTYTLHVTLAKPVQVTFALNPSNAVVCLTNVSTGVRVWPEGNIFSLTPGVGYTYTITAYGYIGQKVDSYIAPDEDAAISAVLSKAPPDSLTELPAQWPSFRADMYNNGVIQAKTPIDSDDAVLYWATKIGEGYSADACGCPIIVDDCLYTYAGDKVYKVNKNTGEIIAEGKMDHSSSFAINSPTYAEGMLFIGLSDGTIQAFDASSLKSLWIYRDALGGQPNCPITYYDGYIYTGFWQGESLSANLACIPVTDENPASVDEEKLAAWTYTSKGGFYWAGAYVCDDYLLIGTDDGSAGYTTGYASLLSLNPDTGKVLSSVKLPHTGDIRSSVTWVDGMAYFTTKGGYFYGIPVAGDGTLGSLAYIKLNNYADDAGNPAMSTCTPTIYNDRAYIGVSGTSQFGAYSGHNITVLDLENWEIAYKVRTQGYPQTSGVLTTAYSEDTGTVYVYFFDNYTPGKLRVLQDAPGQTEPSLTTVESHTASGSTKNYTTAYVLLTPDGEQAQYAICSPVVDADGTIYFKNDSAYLMAIGSGIDKLEVSAAPDKIEYTVGEIFDGTGLKVVATFTSGVTRDVTEYITWSEDPLTLDDAEFQLWYELVMYHNENALAGVPYIAPIALVELSIQDDAAYGDVNGDGEITAADALLVYRFVNGNAELNETQQIKADVNGDGDITAADALMIYRYINGAIEFFPVENKNPQ